MPWFWTSPKYLNGSRLLTASDIRKLARGAVVEWADGSDESHIYVSDRHRIALSESAFARLAFKYHDPRFMEYGENRHDEKDAFPDCDDFSLEAERNLVVKASVREGFSNALAFGQISYYSLRCKGWHRANIVFLVNKDGFVWTGIYEPQSGEVYAFSGEAGAVRWISA